MRIVDLSYKIGKDTRVFPGSLQPSFIDWTRLGIHGYDSEMIFLSTHTGTHVDAPSHFIRDAPSIDEIDVNRLVCQATLIRVQKQANKVITFDDLKNSQNNIMIGDTVIFSTGWEREIDQDNYFSGSPGVSVEVAKYLVSQKINAVGIDSPNIDRGSDENFTIHKILLSNEILVIENLCNLDQISSSRFMLIIVPLKLDKASGSPVRAIGVEGLDPLNIN